MKLLPRIAFVTLLLSYSALVCGRVVGARQHATDSQKQLCTLAGTVVRAGTNEPIRKAQILLSQQQAKDSTLTMTYTDAAGHFSIDQIDPGVYRLVVERSGFLSQYYGGSGARRAYGLLTLRPGQKIPDLLFRLVPTGVITGRVVAADGEPVENADVVAMRALSNHGKTKFDTQQAATTNDRGEYRISGLEPGRYGIRATARNQYEENEKIRIVGPSPGRLAHGPAYYPSAMDLDHAAIIEVLPGSEISGMDILLGPSATFRVHGHITNNVTGRPSEGILIQVISKPQDDSTNFGGGVSATNGDFSIGSVPPGSYNLIAMWHDEGKLYEGTQTVEVSNADVDSVQIVIAAGVDIPGRMVMEGKSASQANDAQIYLSSDLPSFAGMRRARIKANGLFVLAEVNAGSYQVHVYSPCEACYLKAARSGGEDVLIKGLEVSAGSSPPPLELVYSGNAGTVEGTVTRDDGLPASGATVMLVPDPPFRARSDRFNQSNTDQYGHFTAQGVAPGKYRILAWEDFDYESNEDPDLLKAVEAYGLSVEISENEKKTVQPKMVPKDPGK